MQLEALDIVADLLSRFGSLLISFHSTILAALLPQLSSPRQAVRKRTIVALSHLLTSSNNHLYNKLLDHLLEGLSYSNPKNIIRTYIQCIASIWFVFNIQHLCKMFKSGSVSFTKFKFDFLILKFSVQSSSWTQIRRTN